jgi:hypothetical protein
MGGVGPARLATLPPAQGQRSKLGSLAAALCRPPRLRAMRLSPMRYFERAARVVALRGEAAGRGLLGGVLGIAPGSLWMSSSVQFTNTIATNEPH